MIVVYGDGHGMHVPDDYVLQESDGPKSALIDDETWHWYVQVGYGKGYEVKYHKFIPLVDLDFAKGYSQAIERITELEIYLAETDWVITKLQECSIEYPEELPAMREKYADELAGRRSARAEINTLQDRYSLEN